MPKELVATTETIAITIRLDREFHKRAKVAVIQGDTTFKALFEEAVSRLERKLRKRAEDLD
ncbi:hypothetical protein [Desulfolutivibrio sulfoxidireducens]|uniref:hypothetical protein n=1 Tax=Desulfolutivibrio sulfoxidireducens TaxID=2773299 RepID=UPI00159E2816|nr:hypothetical protein [Desulfolutivibrio sulfoxidireducens]QLA18201.1 hypothetical protein GD605_18735 [Desulfolutivibrio sulfoxidireducens]